MAEDVSNKTIVVLVVLTVLVSLLSTLVVVNEVYNLKAAPAKDAPKDSGVSTGKVSLEVTPPPNSATGQIVFNIK